MPAESQFVVPSKAVNGSSAPTTAFQATPLTPNAATSNATSTSRVKAIACKVLSFPGLLGMFLMGAAMVGSRFNLPDPDMWNHIAVGREILATHTFPTTDSYSFTAYGNDSMAIEWLGEVVTALAARSHGLVGLMMLLMALSGVLILLLYYYAYQRCRNAKAAFVGCLLVLPLLVGFFTLRPQLLGYIFLLLTMICLEAFRQGHRKILWVLPALFLLWVNTHGSFILGLLLLGLYTASGLVGFRWGGVEAVRWTPGERRCLEVVALLSVVALAVTPYGTRLAGFTLHVILNAQLGMAHITEYQPLGASGELLQLFLLLLLPFLLAQLVFRPTYRLEELALLLLALYGACLHSRLLFLFAVAFAPLLATLLARWIPRYEGGRDHPMLNAVLILLLGAALAKFLPSNHDLEVEVADRYPQRAVEYLRQHPINEHMLNEYGWGGYLNWAMTRQHRVFIDGRSQLYEEAGVYADYLQIMSLAPDMLPLLRKYDLRACLIGRDTPLATMLAVQPDWQVVYSDKLSTILVRRAGPVYER